MRAMPQCITCVHLFPVEKRLAPREPMRCAAFPDGIPDAIASNRFDHAGPYPGDNGVHYTAFPDESPLHPERGDSV